MSTTRINYTKQNCDQCDGILTDRRVSRSPSALQLADLSILAGDRDSLYLGNLVKPNNNTVDFCDGTCLLMWLIDVVRSTYEEVDISGLVDRLKMIEEGILS